MVARRGRPPKLEEHDKELLVKKFHEYIDVTDIPIVAEFAAQNGLTKQYVSDNAEFADAIKKCLTKKEAALESGALKGTLNPTMAIFSLKQPWHGWRDKEAKVVFVDPKTLSTEELKKMIENGD